MSLGEIYAIVLGWLPVWFQVVVLGLIAFLVILLVMRIIKIVLDALPFV